MILETGKHDSNKYSSSDKIVIQDALTSINNDYRLLIFLEKERVNKSRSDGIEEVEPVDFEINPCRKEVEIQLMMMKILWTFKKCACIQ